MSRIPTFSGDDQNITAVDDWLALIDRTVAMRDSDADKLDIFSNKLFFESPADVWYTSIPSPISKCWRMVRELFVLKWITGAEGDEIERKVKLFSEELRCAHMGSPPLDVFSVMPVPPPSSPIPAPFNLRQLEQVVNISDVAGIAAFCATAVGTKHGYIARIWELAFNAGKNSSPPVPNLQVDAETRTMPLADEDPAPEPDPLTENPTCLRDFDWSQDVESLPIFTTPPSQPRLLSHPVVNTKPRDLSVLRSSSPSPFESLQRRLKNQRSRDGCRSRRYQCPLNSEFPFPFTYQHRFTTHNFPYSRPQNSHHTLPRYPKTNYPKFEPVVSHQASHPSLNWESDPRLSDLSRSLKALGWIRGH